MALRDEVSQRLRAELRRQGRSPEWLADEMSLHVATVNRLLAGSRSWKLDYVEHAAAALGLSVPWLLGVDTAAVPEDVQQAIAREIARQLAALGVSPLPSRAESDPLAPPRVTQRRA